MQTEGQPQNLTAKLKTEIIILANCGLALSRFEQPDSVSFACQNALQAKKGQYFANDWIRTPASRIDSLGLENIFQRLKHISEAFAFYKSMYNSED